jgi:hypothetical protein
MHPHGEILPLDVAGRDVLAVRVPADCALFDPDILRRTIALLWFA